MSRPSEPIQSKIDRGTYRESRDGSLEAIPNPEPANNQPPPESLRQDGKRIWTDHFSRLKELGVLTVADIPAFEHLCRSFDDVARCDALLSSEGDFYSNDKGAILRHPVAIQRDKYVAERATLMRQFGMMPAARGMIQLAPERRMSGLSIRKR